MFYRSGPKSIYVALALSAILGYFLYLIIPQLNNNLWNDESYTIRRFALAPLTVTLTDYHVPNNHILFNACYHFYLKFPGFDSLRPVLENPWMVRLPLLFLAMATLLLVYKTGKLIGGTSAGILSMAVLATSIPFLNFCLQARGYCFTMFFDTLLIYSVLHYLKYARRADLILMTISACLAIYTIPSNLYCTLGILIFLAGELIYDLIKGNRLNSQYSKPMMAISAGMVFAVICYSPVLKQMYNNDVLHPTFHPSRIIDATFFYGEMFWGRRMLYLLFFLSALIYFSPFTQWSTYITRTWKIIALQFIVPIVIVIVAGQHPPSRVFIYLSVYLSLLIAVTIVYLIRLLFRRHYHYTIVTSLVAYLIISCHIDKATVDDTMSQNIRHGIVAEDLLHNYYLYHYAPLAITHYLTEQNKKDPPPVILKPDDMAYYLQTFNIPYHTRDSIDHFLSLRKKVILVTPYKVERQLAEQHHCSVKEILPPSKDILQPSYHHVFELELH